MEAATQTRPERRLDSAKAQRIVAAMRASVGRRGAAGSTFDHVAQEAGVSRGLLHYYFGSKERLLVEVVRHDADVRIGALEERLRDAHSLDAIVDALVTQLEAFVGEDAGSHAVIHELLSAARRNDEIRDELANLYRRVRAEVAEVLVEKEREGIVRLRAEPEAVVSIFLALADGLEVQLTSDAGWAGSAAVDTAAAAARFLLGDPQ
ncbi:MAG TPA: TetR/AcrR family transcriptional regulator [Thermoleophilaceae bacterium]